MKQKKRNKFESPQKTSLWITKLPSIIYLVLFIFVLFFGIYIRFEDTSEWKKNSAIFFINGEPIYSEYDAFYFARISIDIKEGLFKHGKIDNFRFFPDNQIKNDSSEKSFAPKYSFPGNLISYLFYILNLITGVPISWLTFYLIPLIASTVAIPIFFYFRRLNLPLAGIFGGFVVLTSTFYLNRTSLMRLDHDMLNLTLPFSIAYFFLRYFQSNSLKEKYIWMSLSSATLLFYYLWYAHANLNFVLIVSFFLAFFWESMKNFLNRNPLNLKISKHEIILLLILILPQIWYISDGPSMLISQIKNLVFNIKPTSSSDILFKEFPNVFASIGELRKENPEDLISNTIYNEVFALVGLVGAFIIFIVNLRNLLFLLPLFGIGLLVFISGVRFGMYLAPFIGIGFGYSIHFINEKILIKLQINRNLSKKKLFTALTGLFFFIILIAIQSKVIKITSTPVITAPLLREMEILKEKTPPETAIWSWWDYGYAFQLYSRRTVFHDGGTQSSPKTYLIARSFTTSDSEEAWRITSFVSNYGLTGIFKILKEGTTAKELIEKIRTGQYEKPIETPVYWVFTRDMMFKHRRINYFGSFDFDSKKGVYAHIWAPACKDIYMNSKKYIECPEFKNALIDLSIGSIRLNDEMKTIKNLYIQNREEIKRSMINDKGLSIAIVKGPSKKSVLVIAEPPAESTLFFKMFVLREYDSRYFELIYDNFPLMVVYRVKSK